MLMMTSQQLITLTLTIKRVLNVELETLTLWIADLGLGLGFLV